MVVYSTDFSFFFFQVGGIIILGLMVSSIRGFAQELGSTHVVRSHVEKQRTDTLQRTATTDFEYAELKTHAPSKFRLKRPAQISEPLDLTKLTINFDVEKAIAPAPHESYRKRAKVGPVTASLRVLKRVASRQPKILLMRQEKDRFDAMRKIQYNTHKFKRYSALTMSLIACKSLLHTRISTGTSHGPSWLRFTLIGMLILLQSDSSGA